MKQTINKLILIFFTLSSVTLAQAIYSNQTGGGFWDDPTTWQGGVVPTVNDDVFIAGTDSVYTAAGARCNSLSILSGGRFATSAVDGDTIQVVGLLTLEDDAWFYNRLDEAELPGSSYDLYLNSYVVHMRNGTVGGTQNYEYGNLVIARDGGVVPGTDLIINGNLIVNMAAYNRYFRGCRPGSGDLHHTVYGDVYVRKGTFSVIDVGDPGMFCSWDIYGNVYVIDEGPDYLESRIGPFSSSNPVGTGIFNIGGDLILEGGRLQSGSSSSHGTGTAIVNVAGNVSLDVNSGVATNHEGPYALNFVGSGTQNVNLDVRFQMSWDLYDTVKAGANVVFDLDTNKWGSSVGGDFVVDGTLELKDESRLDGLGNFTLNSGGTLKIGSQDGITTSGTTGNVQVSGSRTFDHGASYEYKGSGPQALGDALPNPLYGFGVNNPSGITLDRDLTVNGLVNVINGDLELNDHIVTLGSNATLSETPGNTVTGATGKITITTDVNAPPGVNIGGLGAWISSSANLGSTTIDRYHSPRTGSGNQGISRYFDIEPSNNTGLNATFRFYYDESELNGIPESNLRLFKSPDGADNSWSAEYGNVNTTDNYVEKGGVNDFSFWTLGDSDHPLPVEKDEQEQVPDTYALYQNYPNPFNPETVIKFDLPESGIVSIKLFNMLGEEVITLVNEQFLAGTHYYNFNANNMPSGVYLYQLRTGSQQFTNKMMLLK